MTRQTGARGKRMPRAASALLQRLAVFLASRWCGGGGAVVVRWWCGGAVVVPERWCQGGTGGGVALVPRGPVFPLRRCDHHQQSGAPSLNCLNWNRLMCL